MRTPILQPRRLFERDIPDKKKRELLKVKISPTLSLSLLIWLELTTEEERETIFFFNSYTMTFKYAIAFFTLFLRKSRRYEFLKNQMMQRIEIFTNLGRNTIKVDISLNVPNVRSLLRKYTFLQQRDCIFIREKKLDDRRLILNFIILYYWFSTSFNKIKSNFTVCKCDDNEKYGPWSHDTDSQLCIASAARRRE